MFACSPAFPLHVESRAFQNSSSALFTLDPRGHDVSGAAAAAAGPRVSELKIGAPRISLLIERALAAVTSRRHRATARRVLGEPGANNATEQTPPAWS